VSILSALFGQRSRKGEDVFHAVEVTLAELSAGLTRTIAIERFIKCPRCAGSNRRWQAACPVCKGTTRVREAKTLAFELGAEILQEFPDIAQHRDVRLRVADEGNTGTHGGKAGDVCVVRQITESCPTGKGPTSDSDDRLVPMLGG